MIDDNFIQVVKAIYELHKLHIQGLNNSEEADRIREGMRDIWDDMSEEERKALRAFSSALEDLV